MPKGREANAAQGGVFEGVDTEKQNLKKKNPRRTTSKEGWGCTKQLPAQKSEV